MQREPDHAASSPGTISCTALGVTVDSPRGKQRVLRDVTCEFTAARTAVIGLNGSGKSTLLRVFNGLATPSHGAVRVHGVDPVAQPARARALVGFVFTDPAAQILMPTPLEDIELSLRRRVRDRAARREQAQEWLARMGLSHRAHHSVFDLSGGERQLVALAAVLAAQPAVLVLDEPSTLLDLRNRLALTRLLDRLPQQQVISTHDLELAATAQHVVVIHDGALIASGAPGPTIDRYRQWCAEGFPGTAAEQSEGADAEHPAGFHTPPSSTAPGVSRRS